MDKKILRLCLITHLNQQSFDVYQQFILKVIAGGITMVQLREKNLHYSQLKTVAIKLKSLLQPYQIPLIINDNVILAKEIDAEGVHLGQSDMLPKKAREYLGPRKIIGLSIESIEELHSANQLSCIDYVAASAVFASRTKLNCKTVWGLEGLKKIVTLSQHPVMAIGGIDFSNIESVMAQGASGVAVINAIHHHPYPQQITEQLLININHYLSI